MPAPRWAAVGEGERTEIRRALHPYEDALARADWPEDLFPAAARRNPPRRARRSCLPLQCAGRQTGGLGSGGAALRYH